MGQVLFSCRCELQLAKSCRRLGSGQAVLKCKPILQRSFSYRLANSELVKTMTSENKYAT
ncbi:hypothetical protein T02_2920 [Trichinella nativa]|uniref:Uncharacterized protein n=2 Tax=Trichinella TaxID=6333 RepID=A0A0V1KWK2_9BILA|nr:hypothetical protein T09_8950 [Trichinella sp. T9]KRY54555.1 hypothetical protein T03_7953 [Trichinella britovi]KRZ51511.1 hypothetical protein T02_2920 [Trichinella nativa]KRZ84164.1 hypothetical protein T08_9475 [Trichinella sp. T8]